ncbi:Trem-like transcript 4 protein [Heterocephalus glaber]|uniref:Trem-like transcript 4 protein n=1 Tax=Heterocephalus glaber TaxID=10181 RepID=G5BNH3_HETGA|nr:trem-like transcript 4 protein [Heterocephalus glaber]EHB10819.1 Trem-like transcript 4 protein [Heterocephalus glaber]
MAWEATGLVTPLLLVLLASGSWAQDTVLWRLEDEALTVGCGYSLHRRSTAKIWCRKMSANICKVLVTSLQIWDPRYFIQDDPRSNSFVVTMIGLSVQDSGVYVCGLYEDQQIHILKTVRLMVSKAPAPSTSSSVQRTTRVTLPAAGCSPVTDSPPGDWRWKAIVAGVVVAVLLLLGLGVLTALYLRKARGRARKGKSDSHHISEDLPAQKGTTGFDQPVISDQDSGTIHYASIIHLNHSGAKDPIWSNSHATSKPMPDTLLSVEYASITGHRPQPSELATLDREPRN